MSWVSEVDVDQNSDISSPIIESPVSILTS